MCLFYCIVYSVNYTHFPFFNNLKVNGGFWFFSNMRDMRKRDVTCDFLQILCAKHKLLRAQKRDLKNLRWPEQQRGHIRQCLLESLSSYALSQRWHDPKSLGYNYDPGKAAAAYLCIKQRCFSIEVIALNLLHM